MKTTPVLSELVLSGVEVNNKVLSTKCKVKSISHFILCTMYLTLATHNSFAQNVGINATGATPHNSSIIDLNTGNTFTSPNGKGLLPPNVALTSITDAVTITSPATSLWVYNTATAGAGTAAVVPGYYYWDGAKWVRLQTTASTAPDWSLLGNAGTVAGTNFVGTTDAVDWVIKTNNTEKMRVLSGGNVGVGTSAPNTSALVDMTSTTSGFAMPRMTSAQRKAIVSPATGLEVYDTSLKGHYTFDGTKWDCSDNPAGTVNYFANVTAPNGYLICNGQAVNRTTYAELFNAIGTLYGVGDGSTTFNVPDLRGEFIRGADMGRGVDASRVLGSGQQATAVGGYIQSDLSSVTSGTYYDLILNPDGTQTVAGGVFINNSGLSGNTGGAQNAYPSDFTGNTYNKSNTRPRNIALLPCIKY